MTWRSKSEPPLEPQQGKKERPSSLAEREGTPTIPMIKRHVLDTIDGVIRRLENESQPPS